MLRIGRQLQFGALRHFPKIGQRKLANIEKTGCQVVTTSCPACMLQIADALSQAGKDVAVRHVIELYGEKL